ncbi:(2Fe-2S)-binding protein [Wolinella succinogenes]|uniref:BFD-like [2Fe-2S]-binding domain-containing protein n=1 Tax=Wolinella succinogenes (strain ATCC 29543 / DSM 1740 / CCUG 13145 / JCM 31913 / LMG 7466 / NCTC 11488 / FDC 602W) TaxID=273121 RepID=Q7MS54_WOLSU|nr:(2Fe-2S)-binding protein [Wolinella succinogenes]CAE09873.1 hypothetical protein WS0757 [Wolinella succinogenes]VEG82087.1 nitrite reductase [NAD(P)H], large subunit [Wolinella succinogenes]HCZ18045.1 (2Fe-2S)-binding protein [Helicobacter sp.]
MNQDRCSCCDGGLPKEGFSESQTRSLKGDDLVCYCEGVTYQEIIEAIKQGATNVREVAQATGACKSAGRCGELNPKGRCCAIDILEILQESEG